MFEVMASPSTRNAHLRGLGALLGVALATAACEGGCAGVEGHLVVTGTVLGDTVLEPDTCTWIHDGGVMLTESSKSYSTVEVFRWHDEADIELVLWGRTVAIGACEHFDVAFDVDEDGASGHVELDCALVAGGTVEGRIVFRDC